MYSSPVSAFVPLLFFSVNILVQRFIAWPELSLFIWPGVKSDRPVDFNSEKGY